MSEYKILAIDGGGIRGIIPATFLTSLEERNGLIGRYFHLISGTSTGAIIGLAVSLGIPTVRIRDLYAKKGHRVFKRNIFSRPASLFAAKYQNDILIKELRLIFGDKTLRDCTGDVCIPAVDLSTGSAIIFDKKNFSDVFVWEAALASASAPIYFPTTNFGANNSIRGAFSDGGLWANNPSLAAIALAAADVPLDEIRVLSLGTGRQIDRASAGKRLSGLLSWGSFLIDTSFFSQSSGADQIAKRLLGNRYMRINTDLSRHESSLDALRAISNLEILGTRLYASDEHRGLIRHHFLDSTVYR